tara:strand:+ start:154 stop:723 length:570 start_codon:yes stop_codon:yes gene_type:complete
MKTFKLLNFALVFTLILSSCSSDDDNNVTNLPAPVNEEEVITTLTATLTPAGGGTAVTLQTRDLDGDGGNPPVITVSGDLVSGTTYNGVIVLLNETVNPAENITEEVEAEADEHQFFYTIAAGLDATTTYSNFDSNGNNLGTQFTLTANAMSSGTLTFTLRHEPTKPNTGLADAGGETDISTTFSVNIQ